MIRSFSTSISADPVFCALSPMAQLLFFKLYMHPQNHLCGLFMYSVAHMAVDIQATPKDAAEALDNLESAGFVKTDRACNLVWIPEMAARAGDLSTEGNKVGIAVKKYLKGVCPRKSALIDTVSDTLLHTLSDRVSHTVSEPLLDRVLSGSESGTDSGSEGTKVPLADPVQNSDLLKTWESLCSSIPELKPTRKHSDRLGLEISTGLPGTLHNALVADWGALMKSDPPPSKKDFQALAEWLKAGGLHYLQRTEWTAYICKNLPAALDKASMWDKGGRPNPAAKAQPPPPVRVPSKAPALDPAVVAIRERMKKLEDPEEQAKIAALLAASDDS